MMCPKMTFEAILLFGSIAIIYADDYNSDEDRLNEYVHGSGAPTASPLSLVLPFRSTRRLSRDPVEPDLGVEGVRPGIYVVGLGRHALSERKRRPAPEDDTMEEMGNLALLGINPYKHHDRREYYRTPLDSDTNRQNEENGPKDAVADINLDTNKWFGGFHSNDEPQANQQEMAARTKDKVADIHRIFKALSGHALSERKRRPAPEDDTMEEMGNLALLGINPYKHHDRREYYRTPLDSDTNRQNEESGPKDAVADINLDTNKWFGGFHSIDEPHLNETNQNEIAARTKDEVTVIQRILEALSALQERNVAIDKIDSESKVCPVDEASAEARRAIEVTDDDDEDTREVGTGIKYVFPHRHPFGIPRHVSGYRQKSPRHRTQPV